MEHTRHKERANAGAHYNDFHLSRKEKRICVHRLQQDEHEDFVGTILGADTPQRTAAVRSATSDRREHTLVKKVAIPEKSMLEEINVQSGETSASLATRSDDHNLAILVA